MSGSIIFAGLMIYFGLGNVAKAIREWSGAKNGGSTSATKANSGRTTK